MTRQQKDKAKVARMVRRLVALHGETTAAELAHGLAWYDRARDAAQKIAGAGSVERAAAVIAHLSPRARWETNVAWAGKVLAAADAGELCPSVSTTAQRAKAWRVARGGDPSADHGPKTLAFYRNILGDPSAVCVDAHAARAATGNDAISRDTGRSGIGGAEYRRIARAYVEAAAVLGMAPRDLQAAIWVHVRGSAD